MNGHLPAGNPKPPEHINNRYESPLKDMVVLLTGAVALVAVATLVLAWSAAWIGPAIPYQWEVALLQEHTTNHNSAAENHGSTTATNTPTPTQLIEAELEALLTRLTGPDAVPVHIHYLADNPMPNAFATLGGHIFITRGLLDHVESENGLAMVLAHEYAHIELRHPITLMLEQLSIGLVLTLMSNKDLAQLVAQDTAMLTALSFSRAMERSADQQALQRLNAHYGHTLGADEFFRNMLEQHQHLGADSPWQQMFQTHPLTRTRIEAIAAASPSPKASAGPEHSPQLTQLPAVLVTQPKAGDTSH